MDRVAKIRESISSQKANLGCVQSNMFEIKRLADRNADIITEFNDLHEEFQLSRKRREKELLNKMTAGDNSPSSADKKKRSAKKRKN